MGTYPQQDLKTIKALVLLIWIIVGELFPQHASGPSGQGIEPSSSTCLLRSSVLQQPGAGSCVAGKSGRLERCRGSPHTQSGGSWRRRKSYSQCQLVAWQLACRPLQRKTEFRHQDRSHVPSPLSFLKPFHTFTPFVCLLY